jgi:feruloyl esterase
MAGACVAMAGTALFTGCGGSDDVPAVAAAPSAASCAALANAPASSANGFPPNVVVISAAFTPAVAATATAAAVPEHCNLLGTINARTGEQSSPGVTQTYAIKWQARLPTDWNGKFYMPGGGGLDGSIPNTTSKLGQGYAMAANDSGHDNTVNNDPLAAATGAFATDPQARVDFAYNAIDLTNQVARKFINLYYGRAQQYAYFEGCSMGGREAMMVTQKLPTQFNGVVVGDPAFKLTSMSTHEVYDSQILGQLATSMGLVSSNGVPLASNTYTNQDLQLISKAVLDACDALDGLADGMVNQALQCTSDRVTPFLNALQCTGSKTDGCLTNNQITTMQKLYAGPVTASGKKPYYPWMWDAGIAGCTSAADCNVPNATNIALGWRSWKIGTYQTNLATATNNALDFTGGAGGALSTVLAPTPPKQPANTAAEGLTKLMMGYDLDAYYSSIFATSGKFTQSSNSLLEVDSTDYASFKNSNGKVVIYQPQSGGPFSPLAMVDWYQKLNVANGGTPTNYDNVQNFARLFMVPGMQHCSGGPSTSTFDAFSAVVDWVEKGTKPSSILATAPAATPWPGRTRPLCPFPQTPVYNGTGSIEQAANFTCK